MSKRLGDNITSRYIEAANRLSSRSARRRIVVYVESYDDVFFWRSVLGRFEDATRRFEVMLPSRVPHLERGKKAAVMSLIAGDKTGRDMIACVDADYDYLVQRHSPSSKAILDNPYVFHTYAYSIENMQCYAPSLHDVCVAVTLNDSDMFDFEAYLNEYSNAVFPLFVWSIWSYRSPSYGEFTITDFLKIIEIGHFNPDRPQETLERLRHKVAKKVQALQRLHPDARESYREVKEDIKRLGVTPDTTYMYIQGHHLFDRVVMPMLKRICNTLVRDRENEISRQSLHGVQRRNELSCYSSSLADVELALKKNVGYLFSPQFRNIERDITAFLADGANVAPDIGGTPPV